MENSKPKIAIIDYEMGNMFSVEHACKYVGLDPVITSDPKIIMSSDAAILPGVGAFGECMYNLHKLGLESVISDFIQTGKQFMGICLGLQLLFSESEEFGSSKGLNIIQGEVKKFPSKNLNGEKIKIPQIGWNHIYKNPGNINWDDSVLNGITEKEFMYFVHSYFVTPENNSDTLTLTNYCEIEYCSGIHRNNLTAFQFHPEKSGKEGIKIYENWAAKIKRTEILN